jgi:hypothetical protein
MAGRLPVAFALSLVARDTGSVYSPGLLWMELDVPFEYIAGHGGVINYQPKISKVKKESERRCAHLLT